MDTINVCLACDDNYAKYAGVVIASILANANDDDFLRFFILDGGISEEHRAQLLELNSINACEINFVKVDENLFEDYKSVKTHAYITLASYYRLKLSSLLPDINRVIYFDCDFVVNSSLKELFNVEMGDNAIAGVRDINKKMLRRNPTYVNAGMLIFNLENIRKQNLEDAFLKWTKEHIETIACGDQEILNSTLHNKIMILADEWNVQSSNFTNRSSYTHNPKCIHFVAKKKPWHFASFSYHRPLYFKYLQLTPWKLSDEELRHWTYDNQIQSLIQYVKYRPLFLLRPKFYIAVYHTYISQILERILSITEYNETHNILTFMGLKLKFPKYKYWKQKKQNPYYYYKENNIDITTLPPAEGQIREIQLANIALLNEMDYVCKQNGLKYWLDGGTLLGAVRHKGFIPWDDDIDTAMLREDYEKIIEAFKKSSRNPDIYADYVRSNNNSCQYFIKVQHRKCPHLFVDIFPWDSYGKRLTTEEQLSLTKQVKAIRKDLMDISESQMSDLEIKQKIDTAMKERVLNNNYSDANGDYIWGMEFNHTWKNWFTHYEVLNPLKTILFEGREYPCMNIPEVFLTRLYGDYMAYPKKIGVGHSMLLKLSVNEKEEIKKLISSLGDKK